LGVVGPAIEHSRVDILQEVREKKDVAICFGNGVGLHEKSIKLSGLVKTWQEFMLEIEVEPMPQINSLLNHLEKHVTAFPGQCVARKDISNGFQTILHS